MLIFPWVHVSYQMWPNCQMNVELNLQLTKTSKVEVPNLWLNKPSVCLTIHPFVCITFTTSKRRLQFASNGRVSGFVIQTSFWLIIQRFHRMTDKKQNNMLITQCQWGTAKIFKSGVAINRPFFEKKNRIWFSSIFWLDKFLKTGVNIQL